VQSFCAPPAGSFAMVIAVDAGGFLGKQNRCECGWRRRAGSDRFDALLCERRISSGFGLVLTEITPGSNLVEIRSRAWRKKTHVFENLKSQLARRRHLGRGNIIRQRGPAAPLPNLLQLAFDLSFHLAKKTLRWATGAS